MGMFGSFRQDVALHLRLPPDGMGCSIGGLKALPLSSVSGPGYVKSRKARKIWLWAKMGSK